MSSQEEITRAVKDVALRFGAALVGVANVERFDPMPPYSDAVPEGHHPRDFLPGTRSVISIAQPILDGVMDAPARANERPMAMIPDHVKSAFMDTVYNRVGHVLQDYMLEFIAQAVGQFLMGRGHQAMIFPTTGVHPRLEGWTEKEIWCGRDGQAGSPFRYTYGPFSHRHAATRAGLGEFGYSNVVLTPQFGPRQRFNSILTDAELTADPLLAEPLCRRDKCRMCQKVCYMDAVALRDEGDVVDYRTIEKVDPDVIFIDTPARTDPNLCMARTDGRTEWPTRGDCIRVCPVPTGRKRHTTERLKAIRAGKDPGGG
ncbi:MAG: 4Fe-4S binding protein [Planctomycetota bacterium]|jgi:epoxyqueuosine reductase QueG